MKKTNFFRISLLLLLFAVAVVPTSCGSDDSDPVVTADPDTDNDGVIDTEDACPSVVGLAALDGCPDADSDGVADKDDTCPDVAGLAELNGCPVEDADGDGVADADDTCPNVAGLAALNGCPDSDSDGVADGDDECPEVAGLAELNGCPDADSDGIADGDDECPNEAGVEELNGCPLPVDAEESTEIIGSSLLKINCGGPEVTIDGVTFLMDQYVGGAYATYEAHSSITEIANTDLDEIYLTETITSNDANQGPVSYNIPVSEGTYTVRLHFAEIYWGVVKRDAEGTDGGIGSRVFDVAMENTPILNNFDAIKFAGGPVTAFTKMYDIEVTDGVLNIVLTSTVDKPKISAIEIFGNGTIGE